MGVTLGLEICNRYETNVVNTARDCLRLADDIGADNVVIHLDTYHMNIEENDFVTPVRDCGDRLGYVHIGENHRGYLGSGHIDFAAFFGALAEIDYRGPLTFESFSSAVVAPGCRTISRSGATSGTTASTSPPTPAGSSRRAARRPPRAATPA